MKKFRKALSLALATTIFTSTAAFAADFSDIKDHWGEKAIEVLTEQKVINGYEDGTFRPDDKITREEVATLIYRLMNKEGQLDEKSDDKKDENKIENKSDDKKEDKTEDKKSDDKSDDKDKSEKSEDKDKKSGDTEDIQKAGEDKDDNKIELKDIDGRYSTEYIKKLVELKVINGYEDGTFRPTRHISREEFATIMFRYAYKHGIVDLNKQGKLSDSAEISEWAQEPVAVLIGNKLVHGMNDGTFKPQNNLTRAETAQLLYNMYEVEKGEKDKDDTKDKFMKTVKDIVLLKEPSEDSNTIDKNSGLRKGTEVIVLGEKDGYYLVKPTGLKDAEEGYAKKENFEHSENTNPDFYKARKMKVKKEVVLRLQPLDNADPIGKNSKLEPGAEVEVLGEATYYYLVKPLGIKDAFIGYGLKTSFESLKDDEPKKPENVKQVVANKEVKLRMEPLDSSDLITKNNTLPKGTKFDVEGEATYYYLVRPIGIEKASRGYVLKTDLDIVES